MRNEAGLVGQQVVPGLLREPEMISAKFPTELTIIGRLLTGYSDLEIDLLNCVQVATGDFDGTLRTMFAKRGESMRITNGAKLGRPVYAGLGLEADFDVAIDAMRHCLLIRNQYGSGSSSASPMGSPMWPPPSSLARMKCVAICLSSGRKTR